MVLMAIHCLRESSGPAVEKTVFLFVLADRIPKRTFDYNIGTSEFRLLVKVEIVSFFPTQSCLIISARSALMHMVVIYVECIAP